MAYEDMIEMRGMMSRWDALRESWGLDSEEEAALLGNTPPEGPIGDAASWRAHRMEQRMRLLIELGAALDRLFADGGRVSVWLRRPLASMGGCSPIQSMGSSVEWIRSLHRAAQDFAP